MTGMGIRNSRLKEVPIAVVDFETTGLTAGIDRIVEVSVVRVDPGGKSTLAFDSLINPARKMSATEVHGITEKDVANAPYFAEVAGQFVASLKDCVVAAYNVYFDIAFMGLNSKCRNSTFTAAFLFDVYEAAFRVRRQMQT